MVGALFLDLNATPPEDFDRGIIPREGEDVADDEGGGVEMKRHCKMKMQVYSNLTKPLL